MNYLLGLDLGEKRIGVALADSLMKVATPHETLHVRGRGHALEEIKGIADEYNVEKIVVGLPKNMKGDLGPAAQKIIENVEWFQKNLDVEWVFWDERLTTKEVERVMLDADVGAKKRKAMRDQLSAQRILQSYLDSEM